MGKLVVTEFVSVDGVFEDPGGAEDFEHGGWTFEYDRGDDGNQFKLDELMDADVQLLGRVTYEGFAAAWPSREGAVRGQAQQRPEVRRLDHARPTRSGRTRRSSRATSSTEIAKLKDETDGTILVAGSGTLVAHAARARPRRRAAADGLPDDPRPRQAPLPGRDRPAQVRARREPRPVGPDGVQVQVYDRAR